MKWWPAIPLRQLQSISSSSSQKPGRNCRGETPIKSRCGSFNPCETLAIKILQSVATKCFNRRNGETCWEFCFFNANQMTSINITHIPSSLNSQVALVSHVCQHHVFLRGRKLAVSETVHLQGSRLLVEIFWYPGQHLRKRPLAEKLQKKKTFPNNDGNTAVFTAQHDFFCGCRGTSVWEIQGAVRLLSGFPPEKCGHWPQTTFQVVQGVPQKKNQNGPALWLLNYGNVAEIGATKMMFQNWSELAAQQATGTQPTELLSSDCFKLEPPP